MRSPEVIAERQRQMRAGARRRGRPLLPLNPLEIFELAMLGLSNRQIAAQLGVHYQTLRRFAADLARARVRRRALLQMEQLRLIEEEARWAALKAQVRARLSQSLIGEKRMR